MQPKTSIDYLFVREMLRPYKSGRIIREPDAGKGNLLSSRDRASRIVSRHGCRTSSKFPGRAVCYRPAPPQTRTSGFPASGSC